MLPILANSDEGIDARLHHANYSAAARGPRSLHPHNGVIRTAEMRMNTHMKFTASINVHDLRRCRKPLIFSSAAEHISRIKS